MPTATGGSSVQCKGRGRTCCQVGPLTWPLLLVFSCYYFSAVVFSHLHVLQTHLWSKTWVLFKWLHVARPRLLLHACDRVFLSPDPCLCIIGAVTLIHSLYGHVQAYLQQPVSHPSSRQTVPLACAPVKLLQASQTAAIDSGAGSGAGINGGMGDGGRLVSTLSRYSTQNGTMFTFGNGRVWKKWFLSR